MQAIESYRLLIHIVGSYSNESTVHDSDDSTMDLISPTASETEVDQFWGPHNQNDPIDSQVIKVGRNLLGLSFYQRDVAFSLLKYLT